MYKSFSSLALFAALFFSISSVGAAPYSVFNLDNSINVGRDALFTVLTASTLNNTNNTETGPSIITGNVGIGGQGNFSASDGQLNGDLYMNNFGTVTASGPATISGVLHGKRSEQHWGAKYEDGIDQTNTLGNALADAESLASAAGALANTSNYNVTLGSFAQGQNVNISNPSGNITISGIGSNNPFNQPIVLSINTFNLSNGTFTLNGNAHTTFVLNITGAFTINNSNIFLTGGLLASHVLFNLEGTANTQFNMQQGTQGTGVFLAPNRNVDLSGGKIFGRLITNQLTVTSGGQVISQ